MDGRNRDHRRVDHLTLDALENIEAGWYKSGLWLGPPRGSAALPGHRYDTGSAVAELAARCRVQAERLADEA